MRKTIIILLCCTVVLLLGYSGYRGYELWKQTHWMTLAREYAAAGDAKSELLCLRQVLILNSRNIEACRMMADLSEIAGSQSALDWRKRVIELDPNSVDDQLELAQAAVFDHDYKTAMTALSAVEATGKKPPTYYNILGQIDLSTGKPDEAESDFAEAIRLDPSNPAPQLSLAVVQLHATNTLDMAEARITLRRISMNTTNDAIRTQANRELVQDALRYQDYNTALWFSKQLVQSTNAIFFDKLMRLDVLKATKSDEYSSALADREREAATNPNNIYSLTLWFLKYNMPGQALDWMHTLPLNTQTNLPTALLAAQCQMLVRDWSGMQNSLSKENWGEMEYTRQAFLARALRQLGLYEASKAQWDVAIKSADSQDDKLTSLFRLSAQWNWQDEAQQVLWNIVNLFPREQWAEQALGTILFSNGNTRPLMELYGIEADRNPSDLSSKNNLALTAMLLHAQEMNPYEIAQEVYEKAPTNAYFACTYAFALHLQRKDAEALKIMQQLPPSVLKNHSTAGYYGLILKGVGDDATANSYLKYAVKGQLLPEERTLFQQAMSGS